MNATPDHDLEDLAARTEYLLKQFAYKRTHTRGRVRVGRVLLLPARFVGADPRLLQECGRKQRRSTFVLALSVLLTVSLAALYGFTAAGLYAYGAVRTTPLTITSGLLLASFIYIVERVLLEMLSREFKFARTTEEIEQHGVGDRSSSLRSFFKLVFAFITRFLVAMLIATIVSEPILLLIYEDDIDQILQTKRTEEYTNIKLPEIDGRYSSDLENEASRAQLDSSEFEAQELVVEQKRGELNGLPDLITDADKEALDRRRLADCEDAGVNDNDADDPRSPQCTAAMDSINSRISNPAAAVDLSGAEKCDRLCRGHELKAVEAEAKAEQLREKQTDLPSEIALEVARLEQIEADQAADLRAALQFELVPGSGIFADSPQSARRECERTLQRLVYRQPVNAALAKALFTYCKIDPPSAATFVPYSGLQARQDAFLVKSQCKDPYALRTNKADGTEPVYCFLSAGLKAPSNASSVSNSSAGSFGSRFTRTLSETFDVPDSSLGRSAARIRFLILLLDTLPIFLKFSQSLRKYRAYDALESFEHQAIHIALANGISELSGDTPEEKRRRSDLLRRMLSISGSHVSRLIARPGKKLRKESASTSTDDASLSAIPGAVYQPDLNPDPLGRTVIETSTEISRDDSEHSDPADES